MKLARRLLTWLALYAACMVAGCGGGGPGQADAGPSSLTLDNGSGVGSGGTGSYASGPITAFGSIVVNGIHYDPQEATITRSDAPSKPLGVSDLKLGMIVEVTGTDIRGEGNQRTAKALKVRIVNQLVGPIDGLEGDVITVVGQPVKLLPSTQYGESLPDGRASLAEASGFHRAVEVHGFQDIRAGYFIATRMDLRPSGQHFQVIEGLVSEYDALTKKYRIGSQFYDFSWVPVVPQIGKVARLVFYYYEGDALTDASGPNQVLEVQPRGLLADGEGTDAHLEGSVTYVSPDRPDQFSVNGYPVDASDMSCGICAALQVGDMLRVRGELHNATLKASEVSALALTPP